MQISVLKKLLQLISPSDSLEEEKSLEEISEQSPKEDEIQNTERKILNEDADEICAEGEEDSAEERVYATDTKAHLTSSVPKAARAPAGVMTKGELAEVRALFNNLSDTEIQRLYKRVTKNN